MTIPSRLAFDSKYHVARNTRLVFTHNPDKSPRAVNFQIPWTKTTKQLGASVTGTAQLAQFVMFCPFSAMKNHLRINDKVPHDFSLFGFIDNRGIAQHMTKTTFLAFCDAIWKGAGLMNVHGHSFRIGGAVELLIAGVPPEVVAAIGGWTSLAFLIYWRRFEEILPTHILKAYDSDQISRLKSTLDDFRKTNKISDSVIDACISGIIIEDFE